MTDFGIAFKPGDFYNAGSKLTMNDADGKKAVGRKIHDKAARRIIRKTSFSHRKGEHSMAVKLEVIRHVRAEVNASCSNSHEARRLLKAELADRRLKRGKQVFDRQVRRDQGMSR